jgi:acetyltransferase-like isoleucine patch superfamily enzyme
MLSILLKAYYALRRRPAPYYAEYSLLFHLWKRIRKFLNVVIVPCIPLNFFRVPLYRLIGFKIGKDCFIGMRCYLDDVDPGLITLEDDVTVSYGCYFAVHGIKQKHTPIVIGAGAYVGMASIIVSGRDGVTIGKGCIVGAGSLVNKSLPPDCIAVGVPVKVIGQSEPSSLPAAEHPWA